MRLFYFLILLLIPALSFGQACTEATFLPAPTSPFPPAGYNTFNCTTLTISSAGLNRSADGTDEPLIINVTGDVLINGNININGGDGFVLSSDPTSGPSGGPAASAGGGISAADGEAGGPFTFLPSEGNSHPNNGICNHGGGGAGGISEAGIDGTQCPTGPLPVGSGGTAWGSFPSPLRGGFGGGAGGAFNISLGLYDLGSGGGGGGAIHIQSGGTITISNNVTISARGGRGGNAIQLGGAGGGGSGGVILLEATNGIINSGTIDVRGGDGGINTRATTPRGGNGGAGRSGVYRLNSAGTITEGTGLNAPASNNVASSRSLNSDISCGTIAKANEKNNQFFQLIAGFMMAIMFGLLIKILSRFQVRS